MCGYNWGKVVFWAVFLVIRLKRPDINAELTRIAIHLPFVLLDTVSANTPREMEDIVEMVCIFFLVNIQNILPGFYNKTLWPSSNSE